MTDWTFGMHALELIEQHQDNAYGYYFNEPSPLLDGKLGAYHASNCLMFLVQQIKNILKIFALKKAKNFKIFSSLLEQICQNWLSILSINDRLGTL